MRRKRVEPEEGEEDDILRQERPRSRCGLCKLAAGVNVLLDFFHGVGPGRAARGTMHQLEVVPETSSL